jgi:hypothetical protein
VANHESRVNRLDSLRVQAALPEIDIDVRIENRPAQLFTTPKNFRAEASAASVS